jgi:HrpA-like RNA helicase
MIVINAPLKKDIFQKVAEELGLVYVKTVGMKIYFENHTGKEDKIVAEQLKRECKKNRELGAIYFSVIAE